MKKAVFLLIVIIGFVSCSKKETNLDKYLTHSDKFEKKKVIDPNGNFSLYIPKDWEFETRDVTESSNIYFWSNIYPNEVTDSFNMNRIEIIKAKDSLGLKEQYERYINEESYFDKIIDSGETNFLNYPSYFAYTYHKKSYDRIIAKEREIIRFSLKSEQKDVYYYLFLIAIKNENQQQNMSMMLHCLQTFEILK